jgi:hypothetical protein
MRWRAMAVSVLPGLIILSSPVSAKDPPLTIRKSPFSSSSYHLWKGQRRSPSQRVEPINRRNPPVGTHSQNLEERGRHFTSDGKAPYVKPEKNVRR